MHHPAAFYAGLLAAQPMGFYSPQSLVADARRHGLAVLRPDVQTSGGQATDERTAPTPVGAEPRLTPTPSGTAPPDGPAAGSAGRSLAGLISTVIFALPAPIRLTHLGIPYA